MITFDVTDADIDLARTRRRAHVWCREAMQEAQKRFVDREAQRFFAAAAKEAMRRERAATLLLQEMTGDVVPLVPAELLAAFLHETMCVELSIGVAE